MMRKGGDPGCNVEKSEWMNGWLVGWLVGGVFREIDAPDGQWQ